VNDLERRVNETAGWLAYSLDYMLDVKDGKKTPRGWKRCSTCDKLKRPESFYRFHRSRDGRLGRCKSCFLKKRKEHERERAGGLSGKIGSPVRNETELRAALKSPEVFHT
jgi:hypothetical protein